MSPDRLAELRRQRALVAQHLAWIDAELTAAGAGQPPSSSASPGAAAPAPAPVPATTTLAAEASPSPAVDLDPSLVLANTRADEIIEKYRATEALDPRAAKRGCLVLFGAIFILGAVTLFAVYYFGYASK